MDQSEMMKLAIAGGILFAAFKFGNAPIKAAAIAVAGIAVAKRVPYVKEVI